MRLKSATIFAALLASGAGAYADTYKYTVVFNDGAFGDAFTETFTVPLLLTSPTHVTDLTGTSSFGTLESVDVLPTAASCNFFGLSCINTNAFGSYGVTFDLYFSGDVDSVGFFHDFYGNGNVTITDLAPVAVTPEPSSFYLLVTGMLGVSGVVRRRLIESRRGPLGRVRRQITITG